MVRVSTCRFRVSICINVANFDYRRSNRFELMGTIHFFAFFLIGTIILLSLQVDDFGEIIDVYAGFVEDREVNFAARGAKLLGEE